MRTGSAGIALIKRFEGCRLQAYPDPATGGEPITIGVGHTGGVKLGDTITQEEADELLHGDLIHAEDDIARLVKAPLNQNEYDALVSLVFNIGGTNFAMSTLLKHLNAWRYDDAANQFLVWNKAAGKVMQGLIRRREAERKLFLEPI